MAVCTDAEPCWQFSGELTKAALFPQVADYFIWLITLSIIGGVLLTMVILLATFLCSERKNFKEYTELNHENRVQALEGGRPFVASEIQRRHSVGKRVGGDVTVAGGSVDGNNFDPYPPPKQIRAARSSRRDLVLVNGEVVSTRARKMSASDVEQRIAANQALLMERSRINLGRLTGNNTADLRLQDTLSNDPYAEEANDEMMHFKTAPLAEEKEFFYGDEGAGELNAPIAFDPYGEEEETDAKASAGGFEAMVRADHAKEKEEIAPKERRRSVAIQKPTNAANAMHFDPYAEDEEDAALEDQPAQRLSSARTNPSYTGRFSKNVMGIRESSHGSLRVADEGKDMRFSTMLKSELSKVKKADLAISSPIVTEAKDQRMTSAAKDQLERDKRTLLAGLTADDIEPLDTPATVLQEKRKPLKLSRQFSKFNVGSSEATNDPLEPKESKNPIKLIRKFSRARIVESSETANDPLSPKEMKKPRKLSRQFSKANVGPSETDDPPEPKESKNPIKLIRQFSKAKDLGSSDTIFNDPYAE